MPPPDKTHSNCTSLHVPHNPKAKESLNNRTYTSRSEDNQHARRNAQRKARSDRHALTHTHTQRPILPAPTSTPGARASGGRRADDLRAVHVRDARVDAPRVLLALRGEVDGRGERRGGQVRVDAGRDEDGAAAGARAGRVGRGEGLVELDVERAGDRARQVEERCVCERQRLGSVYYYSTKRRKDIRMSGESPEMPLFVQPVALATNAKTLLSVAFESPRPSAPRPQLASTVESAE